jgi:hypothetical protein
MDGGIEEFLGIFGVEVFDQLGGVFDVGKQNGDDLAFALKGIARGQDFVGQILWGVGERLWLSRRW